MLFFSVHGSMLCLVRYLFVISTSVIDCLGRFVPEMTYYVSSGTLNLAQLNSLVALHDAVADNNWGFRGSGRGRPRGEFGAGDGVDRRNMSEMVIALKLYLHL